MPLDPAQQIAIESEITETLLQNEQGRLDAARKNLDFYHGRFERYPTRVGSGAYEQARYQRHSKIMQRIVDVLTEHLYAAGPTRTLPEHPEAEAFLADCYRKCAADALWQEADRLAAVGDAACFQVDVTEDPDCPIELILWDAASFTVWLDPANRRKVAAVATIDVTDQRRRLRLWTEDQLVTFETEKLKPGQTAGARAYRETAREPNPFGILPFAFVHFKFPACDFWTSGPGENLRDVNDYCNFHLTEVADTLRYNGKPIITAHNVRAGWRPPTPIRPGDVWDVPAEDADAAGNGPEPRVEYLQADLGFVTSSWEDLSNYIDHTLEMEGVPPGTIRIVSSQARSGFSLIVEQVPLILWAIRRQRPFGYYELDLARVALRVASKHLGAQEFDGYRVTAAKLDAAASDPGLVLKWPNMFPDLPGPDRDAADQWELDHGLTSRTEILMKRRGLNREEAEQALEEVASDRRREEALLGAAEPQPETAPEPKPDDQADVDLDAEPDLEPDETDG